MTEKDSGMVKYGAQLSEAEKRKRKKDKSTVSPDSIVTVDRKEQPTDGISE